MTHRPRLNLDFSQAHERDVAGFLTGAGKGKIREIMGIQVYRVEEIKHV